MSFPNVNHRQNGNVQSTRFPPFSERQPPLSAAGRGRFLYLAGLMHLCRDMKICPARNRRFQNRPCFASVFLAFSPARSVPPFFCRRCAHAPFPRRGGKCFLRIGVYKKVCRKSFFRQENFKSVRTFYHSPANAPLAAEGKRRFSIFYFSLKVFGSRDFFQMLSPARVTFHLTEIPNFQQENLVKKFS